jgi:hypothetical protein
MKTSTDFANPAPHARSAQPSDPAAFRVNLSTTAATVALPVSHTAAAKSVGMSGGEGPLINPLARALELAAAGLACFPCRVHDKTPAWSGGFKAASTDPAVLETMFQGRRLLIGVATGAVSGIDVLDLDARNGADSWWTEHRDLLQATRVHRTRSGGLHILFRHAEGLRCSAGRLAPGCDVRADGGYVIWWPASGLPVLSDAPLAKWSAWLLDSLNPPGPPPLPRWPAVPPGVGSGRRCRYAIAALHRAAQRVATASTGVRNTTLNAECFALARFIPDTLGVHEVACALADAARTAGLTLAEIERTLLSALRAGGVA